MDEKNSYRDPNSDSGSKYWAAGIIFLGAGGGIIYGVYYKNSDLYFAEAFALFGILAAAVIALIINLIWALWKDRS
jgi:hypothetical protein